MKRCECVNPYKKLYEEENIQTGDIISLDPIANRVKLSFNRINKKDEQVIMEVLKKLKNKKTILVFSANANCREMADSVYTIERGVLRRE